MDSFSLSEIERVENMQYAQGRDGTVWEASIFSELPQTQLDEEKRNLTCVECGEFAWFRIASSHGRPAHFCAHHAPTCSLRVEYVVVGEARDEATIAEEQIANRDTIIVDLDQEVGGQVSVMPVQPPPTGGGESGGRTYVLHGGSKLSAQHFTLRRILLRLVQSPDFQSSDRSIRLVRPGGDVLINGTVKDVVTAFGEITAARDSDRLAMYWGPIASVGRTPDGKLWLNSSDRHHGASVVIFEDIVADFLGTFSITDLDELGGAHVLVVGRCTVNADGRPFIWCSSPKFIIVRRYRDERLAAEL